MKLLYVIARINLAARCLAGLKKKGSVMLMG
jgi:hypothetical protein